MRDRDFLLGATVDHLTTPFAANAVNRDQLLERVFGRTPLLKELPVKRGRWWVWSVLDERTGLPVRTGRSLTESRATKWAEKAYGEELEKFHDARLKALEAARTARAES